MFNAEQLATLIIKPALLDLLMYSENAIELLLFTCAVESLGGTYLHQLKGPALGIYQMEPATYNDLWQNFIFYRPNIKLQLIHSFDASRIPPEDRLIYDLRFATAMARIHYARVTEPLPLANDTFAIYDYYKKYYNTAAGKANYLDSIDKYLKFKKSES